MKTVSVDELKEWVFNWFEKNRYYHPYSKGNDIPISELYDILEQMPSAEKHGKLIHVGYDCGLKIYECSVCNKRCYGRMNYCPNCGASMDMGD